MKDKSLPALIVGLIAIILLTPIDEILLGFSLFSAIKPYSNRYNNIMVSNDGMHFTWISDGWSSTSTENKWFETKVEPNSMRDHAIVDDSQMSMLSQYNFNSWQPCHYIGKIRYKCYYSTDGSYHCRGYWKETTVKGDSCLVKVTPYKGYKYKSSDKWQYYFMGNAKFKINATNIVGSDAEYISKLSDFKLDRPFTLTWVVPNTNFHPDPPPEPTTPTIQQWINKILDKIWDWLVRLFSMSVVTPHNTYLLGDVATFEVNINASSVVDNNYSDGEVASVYGTWFIIDDGKNIISSSGQWEKLTSGTYTKTVKYKTTKEGKYYFVADVIVIKQHFDRDTMAWVQSEPEEYKRDAIVFRVQSINKPPEPETPSFTEWIQSIISGIISWLKNLFG